MLINMRYRQEAFLKELIPTGICNACGEQVNPGHLMNCRHTASCRNWQHNQICVNLVNAMKRKRNASYKPKAHQQQQVATQQTGSQEKPEEAVIFDDGHFVGEDNRQYIFDVSMVPEEHDMAERYKQKMHKYARYLGDNSGPILIPIIAS